MPIEFRATLDQAEIEAAIQWLDNMGRRAKTAVRAQAPTIRRLITTEIAENFATESEQGIPWPPLAPYTLERKEGPQKLIETYRMFLSLIGQTPDTVWQVSNNRLVWGTSVPYAGVHQAGDAGPPRIPARPYLPRLGPLADKIAEGIADHVVEG